MRRLHNQEVSLPGGVNPGGVTTRRCHYQEVSTQEVSLPGGVTTRRCHYQEVSQPGGVTTRRCHYQEVSQPGGVTTRRCHYQEVSLPGGVTTRRCHYQEVSQPGGVTTRRCHYQEVSTQEVSLPGGVTTRRCHYQVIVVSCLLKMNLKSEPTSATANQSPPQRQPIRAPLSDSESEAAWRGQTAGLPEDLKEDYSMSWVGVLWSHRSVLLVLLAPLLLLPLPLLLRTKVAECGFVLILMALFWALEPLPLAMTAMLPAALFPLFGIMTSAEVAGEYFKDFHFLLVGVICLAAAIEKWGLHRRIALKLITLVGVNPAWLMLGFMSGCAFLSMWVHNTSAVTMVMPIVEAVIQQVLKVGDEEGAGLTGVHNPALQLDETDEKKKEPENEGAEPETPAAPEQPSTHIQIVWSRCDPVVCLQVCDPCEASSRRQQNVCRALCLGIAYSSNIGGIATLPGTSPNLIFSQYISQIYPECNSINFGNWLLLCLPISIIMLLLSWLWLHWLFIGSEFLWRCEGETPEKEKRSAKLIQEEYSALGPMSPQEMVTLVLFVLLALLWLTREPGFIPGWASLFPKSYAGFTSDSTMALLVGLLLFIIPANRPTHTYRSLISWEDFQRCMPWEVVLLVGGGFALAEGTRVSGLSSWMSQLLVPLGDLLPVLATVFIACLIVTTVTEVASNAATISIFLPILSSLAEALHINPLYLLIPATLCTSFSFLLPVSNPANAVVYSYGHLTTADMVKAGLGLNVIGLLAVLLAVTTWAVPLFSLHSFPDWENQENQNQESQNQENQNQENQGSQNQEKQEKQENQNQEKQENI
ncbi:Solute carrier family 13 member 1 [Merluccius polli]|uniref:Solute carrier family 13 member 1 n=1 Tax=Merluccius polli TaxID=89951 RepID=A0AA47MKM1_MERPO|nr:Solute carrier family 13 member 1 [Merluccius polli]